MQFIMVNTQTVAELGVERAYTLALLEDRMKSSLQRPHQFSDHRGAYVIYTIEEMMQKMQFGRNKVIRILKELEQAGYLVKHAQFNLPNKLYLPKMAVSPKTKLTQVSKSNSNHTDNNHTNKKTTVDTVNTAVTTFQPSKIELWQQAVIGKIGFTERTTQLILRQVHNDLAKAHQFVKIITNARNSVVNEHHLKRSDQTDFKTNRGLVKRLAIKLNYLFSYLPQSFEEQARYMTTSLKNYFTEELGIVANEYQANQVNRQSVTEQPPLPSVFSEEFVDVPTPPEKLAALKAKLAHLKQLPNVSR